MTQRRWPWPPWFWSVNDLSELTAGPPAPGSFGVHAFSVQSEVDGVEGLTLYVTYIVLGPNPNENPPEVHQLVYQGAFRAWQDSNLSVQVDPPVLIPDQKPAAYLFRARGTAHVIYLGFASRNSQDPEIQEFFADQSGWHGNNLSRATGAPSPARASPIAYVAEFEQTQHVHYVGRDGHLHELLWNSGGWHWHDLTVASGAPLALPSTSPAGFVSEAARTQHVYFVGQDGQVHGIRWKSGNWSPHDPDLVGGTPVSARVSPVGYSLDGVERVAYVGLNGQVHELSFDGNAWYHQNPSEETNTSVRGNGELAAYPGLIPGTRRIIVIPEAGGSIQQLSNDGGGWESTVLLDSNGPNADKGADAGARPGAFSAPAALQEYVYYPSINFHVVELVGRPSLRGPLPPSILSILLHR